jgi:hypothetical protein
MICKEITRIIFQKTKKGKIRAYRLSDRPYERKFLISMAEAEQMILEGKARIITQEYIL